MAAYAAADTIVKARILRDVDVIVAVHDARRDVERALSSALTSQSVRRIFVVCHNVDVEAIRTAAGAASADPRVEFVSLVDGVRSPAGPFNEGLARAEGRYAAVLGSDDELTRGAIDAWRATADATGADAVIAPLRHAGGARVPTPPTIRTRRLRGARDRLAYRTAPLGLISLERFGGLRFTVGLATGEDLAFTTRMWFSGASTVRHRGTGDYLIHDGEGRVTFARRSLADELAAVSLLLEDPFALALGRRDRIALAVKLWRLPVFGAVHYRLGAWDAGDLEALREISSRLRRFAPKAMGILSRADSALIAAVDDPRTSPGVIDELSRRRRRFLSPAALLPSQFWLLLARDAPLRFIAATWWAQRR